MMSTESPFRYLLLLLVLHFAEGLIPRVHLQAEVLSRSDAVRMVVERNPEVEAARNAWEGARARARLDRAPPDPEFEFEELPGWEVRTIMVSTRSASPNGFHPP